MEKIVETHKRMIEAAARDLVQRAQRLGLGLKVDANEIAVVEIPKETAPCVTN